MALQFSSEDQRLQHILRELGHDPLYIDGFRGQLTNDAITAFLAADPALSGLTATSSTSELLEAAEAVYRTQLTTRTSELLERIDDLSRTEIRELQSGLNELGFESGRADGLIGPRTLGAIERYHAATAVSEAEAEIAGTPEQPILGIDVTESPVQPVIGTAAAETADITIPDMSADGSPDEAIIPPELLASPSEDLPPPLLPQGYAGELPNEEVPLAAIAAAEPLPDLSGELVREVLRLSTISDPTAAQIVSMQEGLNELGIDAGAADGRRGPRTRQALASFQTQYAEQITTIREEVIAETRALIAAPETLSATDDTARLALQNNLSFLGFDVGTSDGRIGGRSRSQIAAFEQAYPDPAILAEQRAQAELAYAESDASYANVDPAEFVPLSYDGRPAPGFLSLDGIDPPVLPASVLDRANEEGWVAYTIAHEWGRNASGNGVWSGEAGFYNIQTGEYIRYPAAGGGVARDETTVNGPTPGMVSQDYHPDPYINATYPVTHVGTQGSRAIVEMNGRTVDFGEVVTVEDPQAGRSGIMFHRRLLRGDGRMSSGCITFADAAVTRDYMDDFRSIRPAEVVMLHPGVADVERATVVAPEPAPEDIPLSSADTGIISLSPEAQSVALEAGRQISIAGGADLRDTDATAADELSSSSTELALAQKAAIERANLAETAPVRSS